MERIKPFSFSNQIAIPLLKFRGTIISYHSLTLTNGRTMVNVAPLLSELLAAYNFPPCASIIFLEIYRPDPVPLRDLVANFEKSLGNISGCIPVSLVVE